MQRLTVLSLFDGISCARLALDRAEIPVGMYLASEIDKYAIQIAQANYPDTIQLGSVTDIDCSLLPANIDLLIGGSPCQDLSIAKSGRMGLAGEKSGLFWEYVRILNETKPKYFILENVASMPKEAKQTITQALFGETEELFGHAPVMINASLVSAQNRKRLFWAGERKGDSYRSVFIPQPEDRGIILRDILESGVEPNLRDKSLCIRSRYGNDFSANPKTAISRYEKGFTQVVMDTPIRIGDIGGQAQGQRVYSPEGKSVTLQANSGGLGAKTGLYVVDTKGTYPGEDHIREYHNKSRALRSSDYKEPMQVVIPDNAIIRKLTPTECERLQGVPDGYTAHVSNTQRYKCLGNAFNVDVVAHILSKAAAHER